jgi:YfiH family protein
MENVIYFKSSAFQNIRHGFFGRCGGISEGLVSSLNCYPYIREKTQQIDSIQNVLRNRQIVLETLNISASDVVTSNQVHGETIITIQGSMLMDFADADGVITSIPNIPIGILTADCIPILYTDVHHTIIGIAHTGWKGAFLDIHLKMVQKFNGLGVVSGDLKAVIGPSIQQPSYEVDQAFYDRWVSKNDRYQKYFYPSINHKHYQFNLPQIVYDDLIQANLNTVDWVRLDTMIHDQLFFSHRRATLEGTAITGRQLSVICL